MLTRLLRLYPSLLLSCFFKLKLHLYFFSSKLFLHVVILVFPTSFFFLGTSHANEPLQAVVENQLHPTALKETNNSILERNRALLQYVATIASSNKRSDKFNYEFVESLVNGGADINTTDQYGQSIFHEVARCWDCDVAKFLLDLGT